MVMKVAGVQHSGTTAERPVLTAATAGFAYFDTTLGEPIWWTGSAWVTAAALGAGTNLSIGAQDDNTITVASDTGNDVVLPAATAALAGLLSATDKAQLDSLGFVLSGTGSPEGAITAPVGSTFHRSDGAAGTALYLKESGAGNTGWVAVSLSSKVNSTVTGDGTTTVFTVTHNLALTTPFAPSAVTVVDPAGRLLGPGEYQIDTLATNSYRVTFAVAPANAAVHTFRTTA